MTQAPPQISWDFHQGPSNRSTGQVAAAEAAARAVAAWLPLVLGCTYLYISMCVCIYIYIYDNMYKHYKLVYKLLLLCGAEFGWVSHHCCGCQDSHFLQQLGHSQWFSLVFEVKAAEEHGVLLAELHESLGAVVAETGRGRALLG